MKSLAPPPDLDISVRIGTTEIPLQRRSAAMVRLIALHERAITAVPSLRVSFDCSASEISLTVAPKLARIKVR